MDKKELLNWLEQLPEDLVEASYVIIFRPNEKAIQMHYNSALMGRYCQEIGLKVGTDGYIRFHLDKYDVKVTVT